MTGQRITTDMGPFSIVPEWVLDAQVLKDPKELEKGTRAISDRAIRMYGLLGRYADAGGQCIPSRRTLARRMDCSVDSVDRASKELQEIGAVEVQQRFDEAGDATSNLWILKRVAPEQGGGREVAATGDREAAATGGRDDAAQNENQLERDESAAAPDGAAPTRPTKEQRDKCFDALVVAFGKPETPSEASMYASTLTELINAPDSTPNEVIRRGRECVTRYPGSTPKALVKHWRTLGQPVPAGAPPPGRAQPRERERCPRCRKVIELGECKCDESAVA